MRIRLFLLLLCTIALNADASFLRPPASTKTTRPNVVLILADDLGFSDVGRITASDNGREMQFALKFLF